MGKEEKEILKRIKRMHVLEDADMDDFNIPSEENSDEHPDGLDKIDFSQWSTNGDGTYIPSPATTVTLPPGLYGL